MRQDGLLYQHLNRAFANPQHLNERVGIVHIPVNSDDYYYTSPRVAVEAVQSIPRLTGAAINNNQDPGVETYLNAGTIARPYQPAVRKYIAPILDKSMDATNFDSRTHTESKLLHFGFDGKSSVSR